MLDTWKKLIYHWYTKWGSGHLTSRNMKDISLHTSGHADISTLQKYVIAINPKLLIPIHTEVPSEYMNLFKSQIQLLKNGSPYVI